MRTKGVRLRRAMTTILAAVLAAALVSASAGAATAEQRTDVMLVGNNWDGTVDLVDAAGFGRYQRVNVVPDLRDRIAGMTPDQYIAYLTVRNTAGEGHDQLVDDIAVSPDGRTLYVSRPSLGDVSAFDIATGAQQWFQRVSGYRSDHMALAPDGRTLTVSATTANVVNYLDTATGAVTGSTPTADFPHENRYSRDGRTIYNGSIGNVIAPDDPALDLLKGKRRLTIIDAASKTVRRSLDLGAGIRPFVVLPDETKLYTQLSFFNGLVEYDLAEGRITRSVHLPLSEKAQQLKREDYPLDSAHHGLAVNAAGTKLCDAGTISDYAAILSMPALTTDRIVPTGKKPYWASADLAGRYCFLANADSDDVSVVSFDDAREVARIPVGDHPQRIRGYALPVAVLTR
ncbi:YncE family protein [Amycolatopsis nigrescens]|uniref:YncE family protein n=1 Tax=Amycolatopsis nigrescens TaxID=381445 RepID=UPI00036F1E6B|nr:YncE family protein [Amycolatopsis nigrescens]